MKFGIHLGIRGPVAHPDTLRTIALEAEELGFSYLGFSDHVVCLLYTSDAADE